MLTDTAAQVRYEDVVDADPGLPGSAVLPLGIAPESGERLRSASGHLLVSGPTGAGTSSATRAWITAARERGELVDVIDLRGKSYGPIGRLPNLRVHTNVHAALRAIVEVQASAAAASTHATGVTTPPRRLVVGDVAALVMADRWLEATRQARGGTRPLMTALTWLMYQGQRTAHHVIVETHQGLPGYGGIVTSTDLRALFGTVVRLGATSPHVWRSLFGHADYQPPPSMPGRGVAAIGIDVPRGVQVPWLGYSEMCDRLVAAPPAPAWFAAGELPPWVTDEVWHQVAAVLEGGGR